MLDKVLCVLPALMHQQHVAALSATLAAIVPCTPQGCVSPCSMRQAASDSTDVAAPEGSITPLPTVHQTLIQNVSAWPVQAVAMWVYLGRH